MRLQFIPWSIAGVPSSQALLGFLITAPSSVCVPAVIGALTVWIQNPKKNERIGFWGCTTTIKYMHTHHVIMNFSHRDTSSTKSLSKLGQNIRITRTNQHFWVRVRSTILCPFALFSFVLSCCVCAHICIHVEFIHAVCIYLYKYICIYLQIYVWVKLGE